MRLSRGQQQSLLLHSFFFLLVWMTHLTYAPKLFELPIPIELVSLPQDSPLLPPSPLSEEEMDLPPPIPIPELKPMPTPIPMNPIHTQKSPINPIPTPTTTPKSTTAPPTAKPQPKQTKQKLAKITSTPVPKPIIEEVTPEDDIEEITLERYEKILAAWFYQYKPTKILYQGKATYGIMRIRIDPNGKILNYHMDRSTGVKTLDDILHGMIKYGSPVPAPRLYHLDDEEQYEFLIPFHFQGR